MPTNKSVKKKNQIPSLSLLKMTCIENGSGVTIVPRGCHNCDTEMHFQFRSILTYLMMEFDFFSSQFYS